LRLNFASVSVPPNAFRGSAVAAFKINILIGLNSRKRVGVGHVTTGFTHWFNSQHPKKNFGSVKSGVDFWIQPGEQPENIRSNA
jgi:hypothetical protein